MKINKPIFWDSLNLISIILIPLSLITNTINFFKSFVIKKNLKLNQFVWEIFMLVEQAKHR